MTFLQCITWLVTDLKSKFAAKTHAHAASDITSGTLALARGGTGGTDSVTARTNLDAAQSGGALGSLHNAELMLVNSVETGSTAVSEHQRGAYLWWNYRLVRATKNISVGNTISIGGNVENAYGMKEMTTLRESIAPVESVIAMSNHAVGDYFMLGNVLMKATAAIVTGEQITASKATPVTIQSQIDTLRDSVSRKGTSYVGGIFSTVAVNGYYHAVVPLRHGLTNVTLIEVCQAGKPRADYPPVSSFIARIMWDTLDVYTDLESVKGCFCAFEITLS